MKFNIFDCVGAHLQMSALKICITGKWFLMNCSVLLN